MATMPEAIPASNASPSIVDEKNAAKPTETVTSASSSTEKSSSALTSAAQAADTLATAPVEISGPRKTPFSQPIPSIHPTPPEALPSDQQAKYDTVLAAVRAWETLPDTTSTKKGDTPSSSPLQSSERQWLTRECILRYLRATKWSTAEATKRLAGTLTWRREYGVAGFTADYISEENATGKQVLCGFDVAGRPCLYLLPSRQNTKLSDRQVHHLVFMLERTIDLMPAGLEALSLLIDYSQTSSGQGPPMSQSKAVLNILQTHYPERLGRALIMNVPWFLQAFYKLISPFIDPVTKSKMKFNEPLKNHVPAEQLLSSHGGDAEFEYDHEVYWPALMKLAEKRRVEMTRRWEERGGRIGESEWILRGGDPEAAKGIVEIEEAVEKLADGVEKAELAETKPEAGAGKTE